MAVLLVIALTELTLQAIRYYRLHTQDYWQAMTKIHIRAPDPVLGYQLNPGASVFRDGVEYAINSRGFRDDEFPASPHEDALRIAVYGDSVVFGNAVPRQGVFPQVLERMLGHGVPKSEPKPIVYNLGVGGYSTEQEIRLIETTFDEFKPDLILLNYVLNDPDVNDGGLTEFFHGPRFELLRIARNAHRNWKMKPWDTAEGANIEYHRFIHSRYRFDIKRNFARLGQLQKELGVPIVVTITPVFIYGPVGQYAWEDLHQLIVGLCEVNGMMSLDLYPALGGRYWDEVAFDSWHPNILGHQIIAQEIYDFLLENEAALGVEIHGPPERE